VADNARPHFEQLAGRGSRCAEVRVGAPKSANPRLLGGT
jgi:hypothetical protein